MDYDFIVVLDEGKVRVRSLEFWEKLTHLQVVEFDTPTALLANPDSAFRSLAAEAKLVDDE